MLGDFHYHSTDSDGKYSNPQIIEQIQALIEKNDPKHQSVWAMTNHDCYSPGFVLPARDAGVNAIWATEISAHSNELDSSLHITCYTPTLSANIKYWIDRVLVGKTEKVRQQVILLASYGFPIDADSFMSWAIAAGYRPIVLSNAHITQYLFDKTRKDETLRVLKTHTQSSIIDGIHFLDECLKESGKYKHLGVVEIEPYEPELSELIHIAEKEDIILSVAHSNFSFHPVYKMAGVNVDANMRWDYFHSDILPVLDDIGIRNYEINAMATLEQATAIHTIVQKRNGLITYGSDNHGKSKTDAKHGLLGVQNNYLTPEICRPIRDRLMGFIG
ncbi:hypothetical protein H7170_03405 [Candidatus Gracilibacteria bacterium]|nr:hypothetical protein [Candidatus Gracilibacteria bacterium]